MLHMRLNQMTRSERTHQTQFTGHDGCDDDSSETLSVCTWRSGMGTSDAEHVEHGALGGKDGTAADGADFNRGHGT